MQIQSQEIDYTEQIGTLDGHPVMEIGLKGGLHIVCSKRGPKIDYLGVGPHRAVARFLAKKRKPDIKIDALAKSDWVDPSTFQHLVPRYEQMTDAFRAANARR